MINTINYSTMRDNLKTYCDRVSDNGDTVIVTRKGEKNVVLISLDEWNTLQRIVKNAEYLTKLDHSLAQIKAGLVVEKSIAELEAMENE